MNSSLGCYYLSLIKALLSAHWRPFPAMNIMEIYNLATIIFRGNFPNNNCLLNPMRTLLTGPFENDLSVTNVACLRSSALVQGRLVMKVSSYISYSPTITYPSLCFAYPRVKDCF